MYSAYKSKESLGVIGLQPGMKCMLFCTFAEVNCLGVKVRQKAEIRSGPCAVARAPGIPGHKLRCGGTSRFLAARDGNRSLAGLVTIRTRDD